MTAESQRITIAEACGIQVIPCTCTESPWKDAATGKHIPDYLNDLNACHEFEKVLTNEQWCAYSPALWLITHRPPSTYECHATAPQRCEAFLKTIGKWEVQHDR